MDIKFVLIVLAGTGAASAAGAQAPFAPEPKTLWPGPMQGATPKTLSGATVIDATAFAAIVAHQDPVLVDVANLEHQPEGRAPGLGWTPIHRSVPGATWLPGAGTGKDAPGFADAWALPATAVYGTPDPNAGIPGQSINTPPNGATAHGSAMATHNSGVRDSGGPPQDPVNQGGSIELEQQVQHEAPPKSPN